MKMTKSYKIVLILTALVLMVASVLYALMATPLSADAVAATDASKYFTGLGSSNVKFDGGYLVANVNSDSETIDETDENGVTTTTEKGILTIANSVAINDMEMVLVIPKELKGLTVVLNSGAYYANGNVTAEKDGAEYKKVNGEYVYSVKNTISNEIDFDFVNKVAKVNGATSGKSFSMDGDKLTVKTAVTSAGYVKFGFGSGSEIEAEDITDSKGVILESKKVKNVAGVSAATVKFMFELQDNEASAAFKIESIDQKASDTQENYKQTFETKDNAILDDKVYPVVGLSESFYKNNSNGSYSAIKNVRQKYSLSINVYSILGNVTASDVYVSVDENDSGKIWTETNDKPKGLEFIKVGTYSIDLVAKDGENEIVYNTISGIEVKNFAEDDKAPEYVYNKDAYFAYEVALTNAYYDVDGEHYKALGSEMTVPSLKDLVFDNIETYESLSKTVYYDNNNSDDLSTSGMSFTLSEAGKYVYNVVFADANGNKMNKDADFEKGAKYEKFVFSFNIEDDAPIKVTAAPSQGPGYKGVQYTASKFTVDAVGCNTTYTLYYNADKEATEDSDGWVAIPKASSVTDEKYSKDGYTYDDIKAINYNGSLSFTPNKMGSYMIKCSAVSSITSRGDEAHTIIRVVSNPNPVKVYTDWVENNVWSIVFLSVGTLCLIGIIVLLCIKPKDEKESD